jgi:hypothetical protein
MWPDSFQPKHLPVNLLQTKCHENGKLTSCCVEKMALKNESYFIVLTAATTTTAITTA